MFVYIHFYEFQLVPQRYTLKLYYERIMFLQFLTSSIIILKKLIMNYLSLSKLNFGIPIEERLFFLAINVCAIKKLFPHLQSKQTDKFFIVKV